MDNEKDALSSSTPKTSVEHDASTESTPNSELSKFIKGKYFKIFLIGILIFAGASSISYFVTRNYRTAPEIEETPEIAELTPVTFLVTPQTSNPRAFDISVNLPQSRSIIGVQFVMTATINGEPLTSANLAVEPISGLTPALQTATDGQIQVALLSQPQQQFFPPTQPLKIATLTLPDAAKGQFDVVFDATMTKIIDQETTQNFPLDLPSQLTFEIQ